MDEGKVVSEAKRLPLGESSRVPGALIGLLFIVGILVPTLLFTEDRSTKISAVIICGVIAVIHLLVIASPRQD